MCRPRLSNFPPSPMALGAPAASTSGVASHKRPSATSAVGPCAHISGASAGVSSCCNKALRPPNRRSLPEISSTSAPSSSATQGVSCRARQASAVKGSLRVTGALTASGSAGRRRSASQCGDMRGGVSGGAFGGICVGISGFGTGPGASACGSTAPPSQGAASHTAAGATGGLRGHKRPNTRCGLGRGLWRRYGLSHVRHRQQLAQRRRAGRQVQAVL